MSIRTVFTSLSLSIILFFVGFVFLIVEKPLSADPENDELLSLSEVLQAFEDDGIRLSVFRLNQPTYFELNGVKPAVFKVDNTEDLLFVYIYQSLKERIKAKNNNCWENQLSKAFNELSPFARSLPAKNALIVYLPMNKRLEEAFVKRLSVIEVEVFERLNDVQTVTYKGEGALWEAQMTVKYYEHFWEDSEGVTHIDSQSTEQKFLRYKSDDVKSVGWFIYEFEHENGMEKSGGSGVLDKNGCMMRSGGWGGGERPPDSFYTVNVTWNVHSETFKVFREENIPPVSREPLVILE